MADSLLARPIELSQRLLLLRAHPAPIPSHALSDNRQEPGLCHLVAGLLRNLTDGFWIESLQHAYSFSYTLESFH